MNERGLEWKVGLLVVGAFAVAAVMVIALGGFSFASGYTISVDYNFSGNIKPGAPVKLAGIKVGKVESVVLRKGEVDPQTGDRVLVRLEVWIEDRVKETIRSDAEFFVNTSGVLGEQYLEIVPGRDYENPPLGAGVIARGIDPPRTDLIVSRLYSVLDSLSRVLSEERDNIRQLLVDGSGAVREVRLLLSDNREELAKLIASADGFAIQATNTLETVNQGIDPESVRRTVRSAENLMNSASRSLNDITPPARALLTDANRMTALVTEARVERTLKVADQAVALGGKATDLVGNVDKIVQDIGDGKGTLGSLLVREEIYADLREMLRDLKRNPWKFFWKE